MSPITAPDKHLASPPPKWTPGQYPSLVADIAVDSTMFENTINRQQKIANHRLQNVASYVEMKESSTAEFEAILPQIREPLTTQAGYSDIDVDRFKAELARKWKEAERQWGVTEDWITRCTERLLAFHEASRRNNETLAEREPERARAHIIDAQSKIKDEWLALFKEPIDKEGQLGGEVMQADAQSKMDEWFALFKEPITQVGQPNEEATQTREINLRQMLDSAETKLTTAQSEVEEAIVLLTQLSEDDEPAQAKLEGALLATNKALERVNAAMTGLDAKVIALMAAPIPEQSTRLKKAEAKLSVLEQCLYQLQAIMLSDKMNTLQRRSEIFQETKAATLASMDELVNKEREISKAKDFWSEFWKWTGVALAGIVAFLTGGMGGLVLGLTTASIFVADLASDGKITEEMMKPITEKLGPALEKMVSGLMDKLVNKEGMDETKAIGVTMSLFFGAALLPTVLAGAGGAAVNKIAETAIGKTVGAALQNGMNTVLTALEPVIDFVKFVVTKLEELFDFIITKTGIKWLESQYKMVLEKVLGIAGTEAYITFLMQAQTATTFLGTLLEGFLSIRTSLLHKRGEEVKADIGRTGAADKVTSDNMKKLPDEFADQLHMPNKFYQILSDLRASKERTMEFVYRNTRAARAA